MNDNDVALRCRSNEEMCMSTEGLLHILTHIN